MQFLLDAPAALAAVTFVLLLLAAWAGNAWLRRSRSLGGEVRDNFRVVQAAVLTLLGLMIGFAFSMAITRYEQRKAYEAAEANAIGTEYLRADLVPAAVAERIRDNLLRYIDLRIAFYTTSDAQTLAQIDAQTAALQRQLWLAVQAPAQAQPDQIRALVVSGMNDVLNSHGYTQAAWWNRIPPPAWGLIFVIGLLGSVIVGVGARESEGELLLLPVLPFVVAVAFFFIADIDSPRNGVILLQPVDLEHLAASLRAR